MQGLRGPGGIGLTSGAGAAPASGLNQGGMSGLQGLNTDVTQLPDNWLNRDLQSATIDWTAFTPLSQQLNYGNVLNRAYKTSNNSPLFTGLPWGVMGTGTKQASILDFVKDADKYRGASPIPGLNFKGKDKPIKGMPNFIDSVFNPNSINFKDANIDAAIDQLNQMAYNPRSNYANLATPKPTPGVGIMSFANNPFAKLQETADAKRWDTSDKAWTKTPLEQLKDAKERDGYFDKVAAQTGLSVADLKKYYGDYSKAYTTLADPVGANWQDVKGTGDFYNKNVIKGVRDYSGYSDSFFDNLASQASAGERNSQKYLSPEYYALHTTSRDNNYGINTKGQIGNINPLVSEWTDRNKASVMMGKKGMGMAKSDPYQLENFMDYLAPGTNFMNYTADDKAKAQAAMAAQTRLRNSDVKDGGQFNLWEETDANPFIRTKVKGGKWKPRNSGYTNQLNIAQNFLGNATGGEKTFKDVGFNENKAWESGFYFDKDKKKFGFLGPLLSIASFIPGPIGVGARIANAAYAASQKNYLGAVLGAAGAMGYNPAGALAGKLSSVAGMSPAIANAVVQGGLGGLGAMQNGGSFLKGALGGGLGTYTTGALGEMLNKNGFSPEMAGAISGGTGSLLNGTIQGGKGAPLALNTALGAYSGYNRGKDIRNKRNQKGQKRT